MNYQNEVLTNVFTKHLTSAASAPRYAKLSFTELVSAVVLTKTFQKAVKSANSLFGIEDENKVIHRRFTKKAAKVTKRHAKKQHAKDLNVAVAEAKIVDPNAPKKHRGRPKGSKNKVKGEPTIAESKPLVVDIEETDPVDSDEETISEL